MSLNRAFFQHIKTAALLLALFTIITGVIYPLMVTGMAQTFFPWQANGSMLEKDNKVIGSKLIGQNFDDPKYFWPRPSATPSFAYNARNSAGSNLGPLNIDLLTTVKYRISNLQKYPHPNNQTVPVDLVTASGSGLDPHISVEAAMYQIPRVARIRNISSANLEILVNKSIEHRTLQVLGEPRVNVLQLNLELDHFKG